MSDAGSPELAALRGLGEEWGRALAGRSEQLRALPVDPDLGDLAAPRGGRRRGRFVAPVDFVRSARKDEVTATAEAEAEPTRVGSALLRVRRVLLGPPLALTAVALERMRKLVALPILSSDALSSVAYGPEAMLVVLLLAGTGALDISLYLAVAIVVLMVATGVSYRQVIKEYPDGGGSYSVAAENLGEAPALMAGSGLLVDYVLTVAVSISAGVAAITSALPGLYDDTVVIGLAVIALLLVANLRGVREAGTLFAIPTYAFIGAMFLLIAVEPDRPGRQGLRGAAADLEPGRGRGGDSAAGAARLLFGGDRDDRNRGDLQRRAGVHADGLEERAGDADGDGGAVGLDVRGPDRRHPPRGHRPGQRRDRALLARPRDPG